MEFSANYLVILALILISFISVLVLSASHFKTGDTCPKILGIPACYTLIFLILMILISHLNLINEKNILFFIGAGTSFLIAVYASFSHLKKTLECPKLFGTIPMCYLSLLTFGTIIVIKIAEINS